MNPTILPLFLVCALAACDRADARLGTAASSSTTATTATGVVEQTDLIARSSGPLTLLGPTLEVGARAPDAVLHGGKNEPVRVSEWKGKVVVLSVVPSIDTRVCEAQTHAVSEAMSALPEGVVVVTVSRDLPFAQTRFAEEAMTHTLMASDFRGGDFGKRFGLEVKETGLLARSVWVIDRDGVVRYRELVRDQSTEPDYDAMIAAVKAAS